MAKKTDKTISLSEKEREKIGAYQARMGEIRQAFAREQAGLADLVDLIGDRYGVSLVGPDATHVINNEGQIVEAPRNSDDQGGKQFLTEDK